MKMETFSFPCSFDTTYFISYRETVSHFDFPVKEERRNRVKERHVLYEKRNHTRDEDDSRWWLIMSLSLFLSLLEKKKRERNLLFLSLKRDWCVNQLVFLAKLSSSHVSFVWFVVQENLLFIFFLHLLWCFCSTWNTSRGVQKEMKDGRDRDMKSMNEMRERNETDFLWVSSIFICKWFAFCITFSSLV